MKRKLQKAFTLIELITVLAIISIVGLLGTAVIAGLIYLFTHI